MRFFGEERCQPSRGFRSISLVVLLFLVIGILNVSIVVAPPPLPPIIPDDPPVEYICSNTNGGIEICDSIDNDCDGIVDEDTCTSNNSTNNSTSNSSGSGSGSSGGGSGGKKGGGGGGGSGGSNVIYFTSPNSTGTTTIDDGDSGSNAVSTGTQGNSDADGDNSLGTSEDERINLGSLGDTKAIKYTKTFSQHYRGVIIFLLIMMVLVCGGSGVFIFVRHRAHLKNLDPASLTPQESTTVNYISQMRSNKYNDNDIKASMKRAGWPDGQIDKLLKIKK